MPQVDLAAMIAELTPRQRDRVMKLIEVMQRGVEAEASPSSDIATPDFMDAFGDYIESHHMGSTRALSKENFEYAMVASFRAAGHSSEKTGSNTLAGQDIWVDGVPWSLKSEAAKNIKPDRIHISKFMELGKGAWSTVDDLDAMRDSMFSHLSRYERIFTLRCVERLANSDGTNVFGYELVEIPKTLFEKSRSVPIKFAEGSRQNPVPASCFVPIDPSKPADGRAYLSNTLLELYFDGGTERKLQIRKILKAHCIVHATWRVTAS